MLDWSMPSKLPPQTVRPYSANDNGPLSPGQVKALKAAVIVMAVLIVVALVAIVARVIYLSSGKGDAAAPVAASATLIPRHQMALPPGAAIKSMSMHNDRLLVHYETPAGPGAAILDLASGKMLSRVVISKEATTDN